MRSRLNSIYAGMLGGPVKDCDFLVVGAGPAGTTFAAETAERARVVVVEEHEEIGLPVQCTGLIAPRVAQMASAEETVLSRLRGAYFHFPGGEVLEVRSKETKAVVVDRASFDKICAGRALDAGAELILGERFVSADLSDGAMVRCKGAHRFHEYRASLIVGADGYKSNVAKCAGLGPPKDQVRGVQMDLRHRDEEQDMLNVYLGKKVAPGFFAWRIPCGDMTRVGLCATVRHETPLTYLNPLLVKLGLDGKERLRVISGLIPIGPPPRTYSAHALIIGDAAGQAKPLSGGGLYTGMVAAKCAAVTALDCLATGDFSGLALSAYQERWKGEIGRELDRGYLIRRSYLRLSDRKLGEVGRILSKGDVPSILAQADIDSPSVMAPQVLKAAPSLVRFAPSFLGSLFSRSNAINDK